MQAHGRVRVDEQAGDPGGGALDLRAQLLAYLTLQGVDDGLVRLDLAAGELPVARVDLARGTPCEQDLPVGTGQHRHGDVHRGRHWSPASAPGLAVAGLPPGVIARELPGDAAGARAALQGPLQRLLPGFRDRSVAAAQLAQPVSHDLEEFVLVERI